MSRKVCLALVIASLAGCGGGGGSGGTPADGSSATLAPAQTLTLASGETVLVPAGTVVTEPGGALIAINGDHNLLSAAAGAVLRAPATATGPADNEVVAGTSSSPSSANVTLLAGSATTNLQPVDGTGSAAVFWGGGQIVVDKTGDLIVSDRGALRRVSPAGVVTTITAAGAYQWQALAMDAAGNLFDSGTGSAFSGSSFTADLLAMDTSGRITVPYPAWEAGNFSVGWGGLAIDKDDTLYLADAGTNKIFRFAASGGGVSVLAGSGAEGNADGTGAAASFTISSSAGLTIDAQGRLYLLSGSSLRMISPQGVATTLASNLPGIVSGGPLAMDAAGNFYFGVSQSILRLDTHGLVSTYAKLGTTDFICAIAIDGGGTLYVGTRGAGAEIFKITP